MRKADYAALASLLECEARIARRTVANPAVPESVRQRYADVLDSVTYIAREFANRASVDRTEFLKACGIDP